jgi:hypothetical protein
VCHFFLFQSSPAKNSIFIVSSLGLVCENILFLSVKHSTLFKKGFEEVRQFFRVRTSMKQKVSLLQQREMFRQRLDALSAMVLVA